MSETSHKWNDFALDWTRGRTLQLNLAVTKTQSGTTSAQDLTGGSLYVTGKRWLSDVDDDAVFRLTIGDGVEVLSAAGGTARATIPAAATAGLPDDPTALFVDCVWVGADGKPYSFQKGTLTVYGSAEQLTV